MVQHRGGFRRSQAQAARAVPAARKATPPHGKKKKEKDKKDKKDKKGKQKEQAAAALDEAGDGRASSSVAKAISRRLGMETRVTVLGHLAARRHSDAFRSRPGHAFRHSRRRNAVAGHLQSDGVHERLGSDVGAAGTGRRQGEAGAARPPAHPRRPPRRHQLRRLALASKPRVEVLRNPRMLNNDSRSAGFGVPQPAAWNRQPRLRSRTSSSSICKRSCRLCNSEPEPGHFPGLLDQAIVFRGGFADGFFQLGGLPGLFQELEDVPLIDGGDDRIEVGVAGEQHAHGLRMPGADLGRAIPRR